MRPSELGFWSAACWSSWELEHVEVTEVTTLPLTKHQSGPIALLEFVRLGHVFCRSVLLCLLVEGGVQ